MAVALQSRIDFAKYVHARRCAYNRTRTTSQEHAEVVSGGRSAGRTAAVNNRHFDYVSNVEWLMTRELQHITTWNSS